MVDFNNTGEQRSFDLIPDGEVVVVQMNIRAGNAGEGGLMRRSNDGQCEMLDCELIVVEGTHAKRKFWDLMTVSGTTDGHTQAADITHRRLRAIVESAKGIKPTDVSEAAKKARVVEYHEFDGLRFMTKVRVEPGKGDYKPKNRLGEIVTPDKKEWRPITQDERPTQGATPAASNVIIKPAWAS
jgi:hypothetical protein